MQKFVVTVVTHTGEVYKSMFISILLLLLRQLCSVEDGCYSVLYWKGNRVFEMSCANKYSAGDISEQMPGTQKSIILCDSKWPNKSVLSLKVN